MKQWSPQRYRAEALIQGVKPEIIDSAILHTKKIINLNPKVIPILTLRHLAFMAGVEYSFLRKVINREHFHPYRFFLIRKRRSISKRKIFVPEPQLLKVQKFIHDNVLKHILPHDASFAYTPYSSIYDAAHVHINSRWLIKIDITNFFESISEIDAYHVFKCNGYSNLISFELARICTWPIPRSRNERLHRLQNKYLKEYKFYDRKQELGSTPQGAPTSPCLSNLVCKNLDAEISFLCEKLQVRYSRYSDDITISSTNTSFSRH
ncbi:RNA-directed DNA polymerase, partial [Salmonella enterica]|nr:RNA-directed DNA polymerase [Salmonella enterica]